jgi:acyl-CoA reductase-like NAD-dependent aldehyde dehydrogenase
MISLASLLESHGRELAARRRRPPRQPRSRTLTENYVKPTVMWTRYASITIAGEEVVGPVMAVLPFRDENEAIALVNSVPFGLGARVWTRGVSYAHRVAARLRAGVTWINGYHRLDPASPWGGFGLSGHGRENGVEALEKFTEVKSVWAPWKSHGWIGMNRATSTALIAVAPGELIKPRGCCVAVPRALCLGQGSAK